MWAPRAKPLLQLDGSISLVFSYFSRYLSPVTTHNQTHTYTHTHIHAQLKKPIPVRIDIFFPDNGMLQSLNLLRTGVKEKMHVEKGWEEGKIK